MPYAGQHTVHKTHFHGLIELKQGVLYTYDLRMPNQKWRPVFISAPKSMYKDLWNQIVLVKSNQIWGINEYDSVFSIDNLNFTSIDEAEFKG